ncbi:hypothetical protein [Daejeonella sp.]|uniref:hypothetical protein n=1 Tax=Daejeonella sp. TaxID=2805397 RepID=UPI0027306C16|nr:hypothetical protein [Daejeonella sp.]MDP2414288.1 hypothetical protein [Daejeonella sp.]
MSNKNEQRLEELEEVVQRTVNKVQELENRKIEFPKMQIPDYTGQFEVIKRELSRVNHSYPVEKINDQIKTIENLSHRVPEVIKVRHHHHFQEKSKGIIIAAVILILVSSISAGVAISIWKDNGRMNENSVKFRMIRQSHPDVAYWADTVYHRNPESIKRITEKLEAKQLAIAQAEAAVKQKEQETEEARIKAISFKNRLKSDFR